MATLGYGTTFSWNGHTVAKLNTVGGIELSVASVDVTAHDSPDAYTESIAGLATAGDVSLSGYFDPTDTDGQIAMITDASGRTSRTGIITFPAVTGTTWTFTGFISAIKVGDVPTSDGIPFTATIHPTGKPTFAISTVTGMSAVGFSNDVLMTPTFAIGTYEYVVTITNGQTSTVITPVDASAGEIITITSNGVSQTVTTGEASSAIPVSASAMTDITITISHASKAPKSYLFHCAVLAA